MNLPKFIVKKMESNLELYKKEIDLSRELYPERADSYGNSLTSNHKENLQFILYLALYHQEDDLLNRIKRKETLLKTKK